MWIVRLFIGSFALLVRLVVALIDCLFILMSYAFNGERWLYCKNQAERAASAACYGQFLLPEAKQISTPALPDGTKLREDIVNLPPP